MPRLTAPRTVILSSTDLSMIWNDPQPGQVWAGCAFLPTQHHVGKTSGAELRLPTGEPILQDNDVWTVDCRTIRRARQTGQAHPLGFSDPPIVSTMFYDLNAKSLIKFGDSERISGGGFDGRDFSGGKLFVDGRGSNNSQFGFGVWNLGTKQWDLLKNRDEVTKWPSPNCPSSTTVSTSPTAAARCP